MLPFENLGDSADAYFAAGVSDAVRGKLTELPQLQVIARGSSVQYAGTHQDAARRSRRDLGVRYLLTGTVRWAKNADGTSRVQVSPELVQVGGQGAAASKWQQSFEAPLTDVFKLQADIAGQVAQAMRVALPGAAQERLAEAPTRNPAAYDAFLRARAATAGGASNGPAELRRAIAQYEEAVRLDSSFAQAWAELSINLALLYSQQHADPGTGAAGARRAERAIALDPRGRFGPRGAGPVLPHRGRRRRPRGDRARDGTQGRTRRRHGACGAVHGQPRAGPLREGARSTRARRTSSIRGRPAGS